MKSISFHSPEPAPLLKSDNGFRTVGYTKNNFIGDYYDKQNHISRQWCKAEKAQ